MQIGTNKVMCTKSQTRIVRERRLGHYLTCRLKEIKRLSYHYTCAQIQQVVYRFSEQAHNIGCDDLYSEA